MSWSAVRPNPIALARLETGMEYRLVLIIAPRGSGKTRLLREWTRIRSEKSFPAPAWVSLQQGDNDIENFLQRLITAFKDIDPHLVSQPGTLRRGEAQSTVPVTREGPYKPVTSNPEDPLIDLINALAQLPYEIAVILDEYHLIESSDVHQAVSFLINYLPINVHLYLATRNEPCLQIAHLRARREMIDFDPDELLTDLA